MISISNVAECSTTKVTQQSIYEALLGQGRISALRLARLEQNRRHLAVGFGFGEGPLAAPPAVRAGQPERRVARRLPPFVPPQPGGRARP
jgi:hypothetical protein